MKKNQNDKTMNDNPKVRTTRNSKKSQISQVLIQESVDSIIKAKFRVQVSQKQRIKSLTGKQDILSRNNWRISYQPHYTQQWILLFSQLQVISCLKIYLIYQKHNQLIHNISQPYYTNLKELHVLQCNITNIQSLAYIDAGKLQKINLCLNMIVSLQSLIKIHCKFIEILDVSFNNITSINHSQRILGGKSKNQFWFVFLHKQQSYQNFTYATQDLRPIAKIERGQKNTQYNYKNCNMINNYRQANSMLKDSSTQTIRFSQRVVNSLCQKYHKR